MDENIDLIFTIALSIASVGLVIIALLLCKFKVNGTGTGRETDASTNEIPLASMENGSLQVFQSSSLPDNIADHMRKLLENHQLSSTKAKDRLAAARSDVQGGSFTKKTSSKFDDAFRILREATSEAEQCVDMENALLVHLNGGSDAALPLAAGETSLRKGVLFCGPRAIRWLMCVTTVGLGMIALGLVFTENEAPVRWPAPLTLTLMGMILLCLVCCLSKVTSFTPAVPFSVALKPKYAVITPGQTCVGDVLFHCSERPARISHAEIFLRGNCTCTWLRRLSNGKEEMERSSFTLCSSDRQEVPIVEFELGVGEHRYPFAVNVPDIANSIENSLVALPDSMSLDDFPWIGDLRLKCVSVTYDLCLMFEMLSAGIEGDADHIQLVTLVNPLTILSEFHESEIALASSDNGMFSNITFPSCEQCQPGIPSVQQGCSFSVELDVTNETEQKLASVAAVVVLKVEWGNVVHSLQELTRDVVSVRLAKGERKHIIFNLFISKEVPFTPFAAESLRISTHIYFHASRKPAWKSLLDFSVDDCSRPIAVAKRLCYASRAFLDCIANDPETFKNHSSSIYQCSVCEKHDIYMAKVYHDTEMKLYCNSCAPTQPWLIDVSQKDVQKEKKEKSKASKKKKKR